VKTFRRDILEILERGWNSAGPRREPIIAYIAGLQNSDGGFRGRTSQSDLYYSVFAGEILLSAQADFDRAGLIRYLHTIDPQRLDFIHLCCWIRCAADMNILDRQLKTDFIKRLAAFHCEDGMFHHVTAGRQGSVYGTFLAMSAQQDMDETVAAAESLILKLDEFRNPDGSYRNELQEGGGMIPSTAAAMVMLSQSGIAIEQQTIEWILSCLTDEGGFAVSPMIPVADLLSTATALQALRPALVDLTGIKKRCGSFVEALFQDVGGFCANTFDATIDSEYTFYGLLTLGNLYE
jgi:prenyltransferase beta subunit